jgi:response regulator of citrate/malate metabolism
VNYERIVKELREDKEGLLAQIQMLDGQKGELQRQIQTIDKMLRAAGAEPVRKPKPKKTRGKAQASEQTIEKVYDGLLDAHATVTVNELADELSISVHTIRNSLTILRERGLAEKAGKRTVQKGTPPVLWAAVEYLEESPNGNREN